MGLLAETKSRRKLQHDPNNTRWSRDETTFGQKILRSQGWQPGQYLGAKDANHAELYGAANASYIRVSLKDDMKGLGFAKNKEDEIPGLEDFSDLLARLNGKSQASIDENKEKRIAFKMNAYVQNKFGPMRFVRGGLLVGDELKEEDEEENEEQTSEKSDEESSSAVQKTADLEGKKEKKSKKRKLEAEDDESDSDKNSKKRRKEEKKKKPKSKKRSADNSSDETTETDKSKSKKEKKKSKSSKKDKVVEDDAEADSASDSESDSESKSKSKKERKEEKRLRKEKRREKREEKKRRKNKDGDSETKSSTDVTPATSGTSTPRPNNPFAVRSRFLKAKREALMDDKALAKIWMVKA